MSETMPTQIQGGSASGRGSKASFRDLAGDALKYGEPRRLIYNAAVRAHVFLLGILMTGQCD